MDLFYYSLRSIMHFLVMIGYNQNMQLPTKYQTGLNFEKFR